jgi:hypothetical protein
MTGAEVVEITGLDGVITETLHSSRHKATAVAFLEPGADRESLALVRDGHPFVVAKSRVDGLIGWSLDQNLLAYIIFRDNRQLLCLYNPTARSLDFDDLPGEAGGKVRGGGWTATGEVVLYSGDGLFTRAGTGDWSFSAFPQGFRLLPGPRFTTAIIGGCGTEILGIDHDCLAVWDIVTGAVRRGPSARGVQDAGLTMRGNHVWVTKVGRVTSLLVYDIHWRHLGRRDGLAAPGVASSRHGWDLFYLTDVRGRVGVGRWDLGHNRRYDLGLLPAGAKPLGLAISDDDRRLLVRVQEKGTMIEVPLKIE